ARLAGNADVEAVAGDLQAAVLLLRAESWRFLASDDPQGPAAFKTKSDSAMGAVSDMESETLPDDVRSLIAPVKTALTQYTTSFEALAADMLKSDKQFDEEMRPEIEKLIATIGTAQASLKKDFEATKAESDATVIQAITVQKGVAGLALVI